jgi:class 3 adenylate cyclase
MLERLTELQQRWRSSGFENPFEIRIGINTGYCNVGNFGSDQRLSYTIIGGEVNLAQRLESNADVGGILMSYETWIHVQDLVEVEPRGAISMKGIARNVVTYAVTGRKKQQHPQSYTLTHPAGVSIELDSTVLDTDTKEKLAAQLSELAHRLRENH